jgi:hypothetical protein
MAWWIQIDEKTAPFSYVVVNSVSAPVDAYNTLPYPTQAAASSEAATLNGNARKGVAGSLESGASAAAKSTLNGLLPTFTNTRPFVVRVVKVIIGGALILAGMTMLVKQETNISVGDVAKVAAL